MTTQKGIRVYDQYPEYSQTDIQVRVFELETNCVVCVENESSRNQRETHPRLNMSPVPAQQSKMSSLKMILSAHSTKLCRRSVFHHSKSNDCNVRNISQGISDCMKHDTVSVHLFQRNLVRFLKDRFDATPSKMIYFSDGAASQYKNRKNFSNLCHHVEDFEVRIFSFRTAILLSNKIL